ncbi:malectin domain-containing carbohydrate-binding protein (plasmid) [Falsihalocynthiibacter sp. SS001]|uniref:malectin domain-containing carbohydrate-binding protein n=1 Tax=Falsihalocynthiibacter sp. SS001 TaxID=3349698 RepID=UPI0036D33755
MAVTNNFSSSSLVLNGVVSLSQPTALVWGPDGRLYVTEVDGDVKVLTIAFGDPDPSDADNTAQFYVTDAVTISDVKSIPNSNDDGSDSNQSNRQVTGIDVTNQYDENGDLVMIDGKPAVTMYVTSSDSRIGAGGSGNDAGLDTNSGVITKLTQTGPDTWEAVDIVRGLARSEENHALNGLEVIQEVDADGKLVSERLIVANGGNANTGAPSNNFAGQQEQPYSAAILEVDLDALNAMDVLIDPNSGRSYVYDLPTLDDPTRAGTDDGSDPFGGNDGMNSAKITEDSPVQIYSPGYRNAYDVEVTDDGRVFTYDNGANNNWGGRPVGEAGDNGTTDFAQALNYIALNLNNGEGNSNDDINLINWNPSNKDQFHEVTRSDDLDGRDLSDGAGGAQTYINEDGLTVVYGGHPNPTRAEGSRAGILFSPGAGTDDAYLLVSNEDSYGNGGLSDYEEVIAWLTEVENDNANYPTSGIYGADAGELTKKVLAVTPGVAYDIYAQPDGSALIVPTGEASPGGEFLGTAGLPADIAEIVVNPNPIEGDYKEAAKFDGALDSGNGSINGLTEYTSTILDDEEAGIKMSGAIFAASLNQGSLIIMGREEDGTVSSGLNAQGYALADDRTTLDAGGGPLGLAALGDDVNEMGLTSPFQGSVWAATYNQNGPLIEIFQPANGAVLLAGSDVLDPLDNDLDGVGEIEDPFEFSPENGYELAAGNSIVLDFNPQNTNFPTSLAGTGLLGAALDGSTPNQDAQTAAENFSPEEQQDGLYDIGGNVLPGGNAPILQIKNVKDGTVVGAANTARDVLHTGIRPDEDVQRIVATMNAKNWLPAANGSEQAGQLTGMIFSDGTQSNFVRVVFGSVNGAPGIEVGYEIGDANYTTLAQIAVPGLSDAGVDTLDLRLEIDMEDGFAVSVFYKLQGEADFTEIALNDGTPGFSLPAGVLQDVLTGNHTIGSGATVLNSGAAIGFLAEDTGGDDEGDAGFNGLLAVDFNRLEIEAIGNEIDASTAAEVGQSGTTGLDTIVYDGSDTDLAPLAADVENFDGTGSSADYAVTGNDNDNVIKVGTGANTITTGGGSDSIEGTLEQLTGDTITDFTSDDQVIINGVSVADLDVTYQAGSAVVVINDVNTITFDGPDFADFNAADGDDVFTFEDFEGGVRLVTKAALTPVIAISSGGPDVLGKTVRDQVVDFMSDLPGAPKVGFATTGSYNDYTNANAQNLDFPDTDLDDLHAYERSGNFAVWGYAIDVPDGEYLVDMYFAEIYHGIQNGSDPDDKRVFDIEIEGQLVEDDYDIIDDAGGAGIEVLKTYQVTVTDGVLNLDFIKEVDQAKLSGLVVWSLGGTYVPPADETVPEIVSIVVENPLADQDSPRDAIITLEDNSGFDAADFAGLDGSELTFSDIVPESVSAPTVEISANGLTATLTYELQPPSGSWPTGEGAISIAAGAYTDAAGNATESASSAFFVEPNLDNLIAGNVVLAINVGATTNTIDESLDGADKNTYGGAITGDTIINGIDLQADDPNYYTPTTKTGSNIDGKAGATGSNTDLDGSALHTYRDAASGSFTARYPIADGVYVVELWFAELYHTTGGNRQGDYTINGEVLALDFDAFTEAGGADTAVSITKNVIVTNGEIVIDVAADTGEPGWNAIVIYDAIPSDLPPTISVADVNAVEGSDATITFSRVGDLSEDVTVTYTLTPDTAEADDFTTPVTTTATILAGETSVSVAVPITDDEDEEPAETFTVTIDTVTNTSANAVIAGDGGTAVVTIAASDKLMQVPSGGAIFNLDFEGVSGEAIAVGGFDDALGLGDTVDEATSEVTGGKLVVQTAEGDINDGADNGSINDFTKIVDVSDAGLNELYLTTRFDNPFTEALLESQGITDGTIPNYVQQGIVFGTGTQVAGEMVKLVWGGVAAGSTAPDASGIQMWTKGSGGINQQATIAQMLEAGKGLFDVASIEMSLEINKADGTVGQWVTLFDENGAIIGGVRPTATDGFHTIAPTALPAAVLANIVSTTEDTHFGVTSSDNSAPVGSFGSFEVSWDYLSLTSPQVAIVEGPDAYDGVLYGDFSDDGLAPTDLGAFANGSNLVTSEQVGDDEGPLGRDRDYFTFEVPEGQVLSQIVLTDYSNEEPTDVQGFMALQVGTQVTTDPVTGAGLGDLLGALIYGDGNLGNDVLAPMAAGGEIQEGFSLPGFDLPLEAGTYTLWLNQGADLPTLTTFDFVLIDRPADVELSIADAANVIENGDFGTTELAFEITASDSFDGTLSVTFDIDGEAVVEDIVFVGGTGVLTRTVANDDIENGAETVSVTLVSAVDAIGDDTVAIGVDSASGSVTEDDGLGSVEKGDLAFAINVNGPEVTATDGTVYEADSDSYWVGSSKYTDGAAGADAALAGGDYDRDGDADADDTLYSTERYGGKNSTMTFTRDGLEAGNYIATLKFVELYDPAASGPPENARVFSVTANGVEVITDLRLFDHVEHEEAYDVEVPVTIGEDGILTLGFDASVDNGKVGAIALHKAVITGAPTDVTLSVADVSADEDGGLASVVFTREGDTTSDVTITFDVADGTGVAGVDYEIPASNTVTILAGETTASVDVVLIDNDEEAPAPKTFTVSITDVDTAGGESADLGTGTATVTIDDDEAFDPADIDGDGVLNGDDPLAYDGENGLGNVLTVGGSFRQDFDVNTTDPFSEEAGFTGLLINTTDGYDPAGSSETDPYGDRTTEGNAIVEDGTLKIVATETDTFSTGTGTNNTIKDNYLRGADVSGVDLFTLETKIANPFPEVLGANTQLQYAGIGIHIGAGGTDDWVKLVYGPQNSGVRLELAHNNSLDGGAQKAFIIPTGAATPSGATTVTEVDAAPADIILRLTVDKTGETPTLTGSAVLLDADGLEIGLIDLPSIGITGSFAAALEGNNPLTGGTGGITYGVAVTEWGSGTNNSFTGEWDYIDLYAPDLPPTVDAGIAAQDATENTEFDFTLPLDVFADDNGVINLTLTAVLDDGLDSPLPTWLTFEDGRFTGTPMDGDDGVLAIKVIADDGTNPPVSTSFELTVEDIPGPFVWSADADGDGFGTSADQVTAYEAPGEAGDYVLASLGDDLDDTDDTIYPDAPEINDGKDNDQDGEIDEDNAAPVAGADSTTGAIETPVIFTRTELLLNDSDPDGDALKFSGVSNPVNGTLDYDAATGVIAFTPDAGFVGTGSFDYTVSDDFGGVTVQTVEIEVSDAIAVDAQSIALSNANVSSYTFGQDRVESDEIINEVAQTVNITGNAWKKIELGETLDVSAGMSLRFTVNTANVAELLAIGFDSDNRFTNDGTAIFQIGGRHTNGNFDQDFNTYNEGDGDVTFEIPLDDYVGQSFSHLVLVNDDDNPLDPGLPSGATYSDIEILRPVAVNTAPVAAEDSQQMESDQALEISAAELLANDFDADGDALTVTSVSNPVNGTVSLLDGLITFTATPGYSGPATFAYTIEDSEGGTSVSTVNIDVLAPGGGDVIKSINFNDNEITSYDAQDSKPGAGYTVSPTGDSLTLDGNVWKKTAITGGDYTITEDTVLRFDLTILTDTGEIVGIGLENDNSFRTDNDALFQLFGSQNFSSWSNQGSNGLYGNVGEVTSYEISLADYAGQTFSTLAFINDDDRNNSSVVEFANVELVEELVTVGPDTKAPEVFGGEIEPQTVTEDEPFEIELPFIDEDTSFEDLTFSFTNLPSFMSEVDGILVGQPENADVGVYDIDVTATDPEGNATTAQLQVTVENVNDAPQLVGVYEDAEAIIDNEMLLELPEGLFVDIDAQTVLIYSATGLPEGVDIDTATGALSGAPTESGDFTVTITAHDGPIGGPDTLTASTSFNLDVASGPPRESVFIEAEDFTAFSDPNEAYSGFFTRFAATASGSEVIRVQSGGEGSISTDLDSAGVVPGFYDLSVIHFDENDGMSTVTVKLDHGDGEDPVEVGTFVMDRDEPGQGSGTQAGNIFEATFETLYIPAGAKLIIEGVAEGGEFLRIDAVRFDPIDNTPPAIDTPAQATISEGNQLVADVDATDLEGSEVTYGIAGGADAALFSIDAVTGELSFIAAPDFEAPQDADADNVYEVTVSASDGDVSSEQEMTVTVENLEEAPIVTSATAFEIAENSTNAATVEATDPDGNIVTYALAGTGADEDLFTVDPNTGVVSFIAAPDFEVPTDAGGDNVYDVSVAASDGTSTTTSDLQITVTDANDAPVAVADPAPQALIVGSPAGLDITGLFTDQDAADTLTYEIVSGAPAGITGIVDGVLSGIPSEVGAFDVVISASDGIAPPVQTTIVLNVDEADNTYGRVAPTQDLDEDGALNATDPDVDGDEILNVDDSFAYDADNGTLIADGESIDLTFDVNGTPYQNGFTGLLQAGVKDSSDLKDFDEDTGSTSVANGLLTTTSTTGDTGTVNTPEDDFQLGVKNADFTVEARVLNPFMTDPAVSYSQIGVHVGIDSTDFAKFVFGNAVEFSTRTNDVEAKVSGGNQPLPNGLTTADFSAVDITLNVNSTSPTSATISAVATFLDENGNGIAGATGISFGSAEISGALAAALADETVGVGTGFTHVHAGAGQFDAQLDSFKVTAVDGGSVDPTNALNVFAEEDDIFTGNSYGATEVGSAVLEVMTGNNNIESSNYGANSFQLTNTGDKKIAAVFIDVTTALYQDSVFDPDGAGGDDATKPWGINSGGPETGASISGGEGGYFLPGDDPLPNTTGTGGPSNGGYKGAIVKFTDFDNGETVGFSGDMDPNSIAGLTKASVDGTAIDGWDVGGISGHEIIGSTFTILFDDGTTATGQLASDGSASGSKGLATESGFTSDAPTLVVNGFGAGEVGTYGVDQPSIIVTGDPGSIVRITMTKGFNPVTNDANGIADLVDARLERYDFKASNTFDNQTIDVTIGADGTFDATGMFDYDDSLKNNKGDGTFDGDDVADIGFVASVIDPNQGNISVSPVTTPIYLKNEGGPVEGDPVGNDGGTALEVFAGESDLITSAIYSGGEQGSAVLEVLKGNDNIEGSNYGANSFVVTNTGDKKISAVFIDVSDALYQDSVFDPDGAGGDNVAKAWAVNSAGGTGAYISGGTGGYFIPGTDPLPNTTGTGGASNGGYKGAIVKFNDFDNGETVGFSGDMDPNSIAGLTKASVDGTAIDSWDVGGISGHELIGSRFTVLFDDGTTATGQLASDGSASGSQALASQSLTPATAPTLTVNGVAQGGVGTYGGTQPEIIVTGDPGDTVRITMTKGFNPVVETSNGIAQLVEDRLDRYDFKANNNFDTQNVDVVIGADGTFDATGMFDYDDAVANNKGDGTFAGDDVAQIGFVASVIDPSNGDLAISDVTAPIYLSNQGGPVVGDPEQPFEGYFEIIGSGSNARFKIQVEDANGTGGTTPPGDWTYSTEPDGNGNQAGAQGDGYYIWKEGAVSGTNAPQGILEYEIYIPEGEEGVYSFRARGSRDQGTDSDQANDIWLKIDDDAEALQVNSTNSVSSGGFVKVYGVGTGGWGNTGTIDSVSEEEGNFKASFELSAGFHTIALAGRSGGYHIDSFDLYKGTGGFPSSNASNSAFISEPPSDPGEPGSESVYAITSSSDDWEEFGGAGSSDLEFGLNGAQSQSVGLRFTGIDIPEDSVISEAYLQFNAYETSSGNASFTIEIEDTESAATYSGGSTPDDRDYLAEEFDWNDVEEWSNDGIYRSPDIADLIEAAIGTDGVLDGELGFRITGSGSRAAHSFDSDGFAPELVIMFEDDGL